jgi:hypothetical protein
MLRKVFFLSERRLRNEANESRQVAGDAGRVALVCRSDARSGRSAVCGDHAGSRTGGEVMVVLLRTIVGVTLITIGMIGILLPIIPGIPLVLAGVATMGRDHPLLRPVFERLNRWRNRRAGRAPSSKEPLKQSPKNRWSDN